MFFFNFVVEHWILSLIIYILASLRPALRFYQNVIDDVRERWWIDRPRPVIEWVFSKVLFVSAFVFVPVLWLIGRPFEFRRRMREKEEYEACVEQDRQNREKQKQRELEREQENKLRAEARKSYFATDPPKLYYNTVNGITAVMRPADYEECKLQTKRALRDQRWTKEGVLMPSHSARIFLQQSGLELFRTNFNTKEEFSWTCGWLSRFDEVVERNGVQLEQKTDIFVPFVNESVLPFKDHLPRMHHQWSEGDLTMYLVSRQAPQEMWPLR
jgi:hypothetical protein